MKRGLVLLEVMIALLVLSVVVVAFLGLSQGSHRLVARSHDWSEAAAQATAGMERAKLALPALPLETEEELPRGLRRRTTAAMWRPGLALVRVTVALPEGGELDVVRLGRAAASGREP